MFGILVFFLLCHRLVGVYMFEVEIASVGFLA